MNGRLQHLEEIHLAAYREQAGFGHEPEELFVFGAAARERAGCLQIHMGKPTVPSLFSVARLPARLDAGEVRQEKRLTITIPAGTEDGTRLRLKGQGAKGRGDVVVVIQVEPDRFFRREGLDVIGVVPINLAQALLGSKIKVRTLDGKRGVLKVPPGTQHGQKFRIPGQGIERNGRRGDQYVEIHVQIPEKLTPDQEAAVREFAEKSGMKH